MQLTHINAFVLDAQLQNTGEAPFRQRVATAPTLTSTTSVHSHGGPTPVPVVGPLNKLPTPTIRAINELLDPWHSWQQEANTNERSGDAGQSLDSMVAHAHIPASSRSFDSLQVGGRHPSVHQASKPRKPASSRSFDSLQTGRRLLSIQRGDHVDYGPGEKLINDEQSARLMLPALCALNMPLSPRPGRQVRSEGQGLGAGRSFDSMAMGAARVRSEGWGLGAGRSFDSMAMRASRLDSRSAYGPDLRKSSGSSCSD